MGLFANTLFSILLGWVQTAASWLWSLITNTDVHAWLRWVLDNWLSLVILLCLAGVAVDFIVYLIRWQPYRIWKNVLQRFKSQKAEDRLAAEETPVLQRKWLYADGSTEVEDIPAVPLVKAEESSDRLAVPVRPARRIMRRAEPERAYHQPVYPPQWDHSNQDQQGGNE